MQDWDGSEAEDDQNCNNPKQLLLRTNLIIRSDASELLFPFVKLSTQHSVFLLVLKGSHLAAQAPAIPVQKQST